MAEADYERSLNIIREEVFAATDAFYTMIEIKNQANYDDYRDHPRS
jgi:hypothetical protein